MHELRAWLQEVRNAAAIVHASSELLDSDHIAGEARAFVEAAHERGLERLSDVLLADLPAGVDLSSIDMKWPEK
ncbi:MAG: hypothetical protein ACLGHT_03155 [Acidimicrobiia bacterium]